VATLFQYGGLNTYGYVGGNPIAFSDAFGLQARSQIEGFVKDQTLDRLLDERTKERYDFEACKQKHCGIANPLMTTACSAPCQGFENTTTQPNKGSPSNGNTFDDATHARIKEAREEAQAELKRQLDEKALYN
jgi:hypothetical protein